MLRLAPVVALAAFMVVSLPGARSVFAQTGTFTVNKAYVSGQTGPNVTVTLTCTGGVTVIGSNGNNTGTAGVGSPAQFVVTGMTGSVTCTASEAATTGFVVSTNTCSAVTLADSGTASCTITNQLAPGTSTFSVIKSYVGTAGPAVPITIGCTGGTPSATSGNASATSPLTVIVTGITVPASCTATETAPTGYTMSNTTCAPVTVTVNTNAFCTITNTANALPTGSFTVNKIYSNGVGPAVTVILTCTGGATTSGSLTAGIGSPATFSVSNIATGGTTCTAAESLPTGYSQVSSTCSVAVSLSAGGTAACPLTNTLLSTYNPNIYNPNTYYPPVNQQPYVPPYVPPQPVTQPSAPLTTAAPAPAAVQPAAAVAPAAVAPARISAPNTGDAGLQSDRSRSSDLVPLFALATLVAAGFAWRGLAKQR